ncbi:MAG: hypothetical protein GOV00_03860 [Candidatus Altiarchaeota archaeon]|nr:hypothetical protein [Candidatus Altiarchaeota archaeon]
MFSLRVAVVGPKEKKEDILPAFEKAFRKAIYAPFDEVMIYVGDGIKTTYKKHNLADFDYVLILPDSPRKEIYYTIARALERKTIVSIKSETLMHFWNQPLILQKLASAGLPIRKTFAVAQDVACNTIVEKFKFPVIVNAPKGKRVLINNEETLKGVLSLFGPGHMMVMQKPIKATATTVVFVAGRDVIAYENVKGKRKSIHVDEALKKKAVKVAKVLRTDFCSVIFINTGKTSVISKVLLYPNFKIFNQVGGQDPAVKMVSAIGESIQERELTVEDVVGKITNGFAAVARWLSHEISNFGPSK